MTLICSLFATILSGCTYESTVLEKDTETDMISIDENNTEEGENINVPSLTQELNVEDENFSLICTYDTGDYNLDNWHVTDSKAITMKVKTKNLPEGYEVYIDHVHADISLKSTSEQINGITQDSMDDTFHGQTQNGFYINDTDEYYNIFAIEGYTDQFYSLWGYAFGTYGSVSSSYERLTEENIIKVGTYAEKIQIVYDISIKKPDSDKYYTKSVLSELLIPVSQNPGTTTVTKDFWTDEIIDDEN